MSQTPVEPSEERSEAQSREMCDQEELDVETDEQNLQTGGPHCKCRVAEPFVRLQGTIEHRTKPDNIDTSVSYRSRLLTKELCSRGQGKGLL